MSLSVIYSRATSGIEAPLVTVEAHLPYGMPGFCIVGLPETAVKESKDRVRSALMNSHFDFPDRRITINLGPADLPKDGGRFDLPIALGILAASQQIAAEQLTHYEFVGELALSGELRPIRGVLPVVLAAKQAGRQLIVPAHNAHEAGLVREAKVLYAKNLLEVCAYLQGKQMLPSCEPSITPCQAAIADLADVKGQSNAKRALEIAAAGQHSLLLIGPPGTGKSMLASRMSTLLPEMTEQEALAQAAIASVSLRGFDATQWKRIPFRAPHHSSSSAALVGGGCPPRPGEISLAHHGILFLDELPEFNRQVLECLREPLESGYVTISRAAFQAIFPAQFQLLAAMNPCPCGYAGSTHQPCRCSPEQIKRYQEKLSGPLLDRLDMQVEVGHLSPELLNQTVEAASESSAVVRARVLKARAYQLTRQHKCNAALLVPELARYSQLQPDAQSLLNAVMVKFNLSARAYHRIIKVARTIADLAGSLIVNQNHLSEALNYRCLDRTK